MSGAFSSVLLNTLFLPLALSMLCFIFARAAKWIALAAEAAVIVMALLVFKDGNVSMSYLNLRADILSSGIFLAASLITFLITIYSFKFLPCLPAGRDGRENNGGFYGYVLLTLGASAGALFANDYFTLLSFWGALGAILYMMVAISGPLAAPAAKKALLIVGGTDALMVLGAGIVWLITKTLQIGLLPINLTGTLPTAAFLCLAAGAFAKAGAVPLHGWIPDISEVVPVPVMALLPASLDKLLGIYLLSRLCLDVFNIIPNSPVSILLLILGSVTIMIGVMAALVQHNMKKLLSFHAVSQVGYMILGIGTALPVGIAGGLFHMLNNALYKSCLFLTAGSVERSAGTTELDRLGGLSRYMPFTFCAALIASLAISGVPPLNGFFSKWMVYQSVIQLSSTSPFWVIWLVAAMFGSALTLASFVKLIHAVYLGQPSAVRENIKEVPSQMWLPALVLAATCVVFGIFAFTMPLAGFVIPSVNGVSYAGDWSPLLATAFILIGLIIGLLMFWFGKEKKTSFSPVYIGGEIIDEDIIKVPGTGFYNTIRDYGPLENIYALAGTKAFDVYTFGSRCAGILFSFFSRLHNGILQTYVSWMLLGVTAIMLYMLLHL